MSEDRKTWRIHGNARLKGSVRVHGNKNSALPCMTASLLLPKVGQSIVLKNVPKIRDVQVLADILSHLGVTTTWERSSLRLTRTKTHPKPTQIPNNIITRIRGSIVLLGPLAGLWKDFKLAKPGGDKIGTRPITAHLTALSDLGVRISEKQGVLTVSHGRPLTGVRRMKVWLLEQSVTATEIVLLYSAFLGVELWVNDAATEPHIVTLCHLLESMGATIEGIGSDVLTIRWSRGVREPKSATRLDDDFMEATTLAIAAAITGSNVDVLFHNADSLELTDRYMKLLGVSTSLEPEKNRWRIRGSKSIKKDAALVVIKAEPWPRFHTDVMSLFVVLATQSKGHLKFIEYMYDDRFGFVQALKDMGARIQVEGPHVVRVDGGTVLGGNEMLLRPDIRSGAAMLLAALAAKGTSVLHDRKGVIARGYENLPGQLSSLGADIEEIEHLFE